MGNGRECLLCLGSTQQLLKFLYFLNLYKAASSASAALASAFTGTATGNDTPGTTGRHARQSGQKEMIQPSGERV